jgi:anaerobic sulfite reductase subunit B
MTMTPVPYRVVARREETADTVTLDLVPRDAGLARWHPGQFTMVYAFGVGEVPISVSGGAAGGIRHTVRAVGAVSRAICTTAPGSVLGLRGPYGRGWRLPERAGADLLVIAGGIGLAPLRPVVLSALTRRARFGAVTVLIGARTPDDLIFTDEYDTWRGPGPGCWSPSTGPTAAGPATSVWSRRSSTRPASGRNPPAPTCADRT